MAVGMERSRWTEAMLKTSYLEGQGHEGNGRIEFHPLIQVWDAGLMALPLTNMRKCGK